MYNVYDKSNVYYLRIFGRNEVSLIGDKDDLILFLSKGYGFSKVFDWKTWEYKYDNFPNETSPNGYFDDLNMGNDIYFIDRDYSFYDSKGERVTSVEKICYGKRYTFFDGLGRIIDVRNFKKETLERAYKENERRNKRNRFWYYDKSLNGLRPMRPKSHQGNFFRNKGLNNKKRVLTMDSMFKNDPDYKEFHFKRIEDVYNPYPSWFYDTNRTVEGNWKSQYKVNKQYNIHKNGKNNKSIRKDFWDDDSIDDIDEMLEEDFLNKFND